MLQVNGMVRRDGTAPCWPAGTQYAAATTSQNEPAPYFEQPWQEKFEAQQRYALGPITLAPDAQRADLHGKGAKSDDLPEPRSRTLSDASDGTPSPAYATDLMRAAKQLRGVMAFFEASKASKKQKNKPRAAGVSRHVIHKHLPQQRLSKGPEGTPAHQGRVYAMATGGGIVAAGGVDKALYVHCIGKCQHACQTEGPGDDFPAPGQGPHVVKMEHKSSIFAVALCHDCSSGDTYIAAGGEDKRVSVYRADKSFASRSSPLTRVEREFKSKESVLTASLSWRTNPHNKSKASLLLAVGGVDCHVRIFDVMDGVLIYSVELPDFVISVTLHSAKDLLAISAKPARVLVLKMDEVFDHNTEVNEAERTKFADFQSKYMQTEHKIALREKVAVRNKRIWEQVPTCI